MRRLILAVTAAALLSGCFTGDDEARDTLTKAGYSAVEVGSLVPFACGEHDKVGVRFTATNPAGLRVSGVVCCGILKGCTVRF